MKVTQIKAAVKTKGRYNIFVDEKYSFSLTEAQLIEEKLKLGQEISDLKLSELKGESEFGKKYARALELVFRRPRSQKELFDYARRKEWDDVSRDRIIEKLQRSGYQDDTKFAQFWLRGRMSGKPISKRKISVQLRQKGIDREIIDQVISTYSIDEERIALEDLVAKKRSKYTDQQKLMAYLARQGFNFDTIKSVLNDQQ